MRLLGVAVVGLFVLAALPAEAGHWRAFVVEGVAAGPAGVADAVVAWGGYDDYTVRVTLTALDGAVLVDQRFPGRIACELAGPVCVPAYWAGTKRLVSADPAVAFEVAGAAAVEQPLVMAGHYAGWSLALRAAAA